MNELENKIIVDYPSLGPKKCSIKYNISYQKIIWIKEKYSLLVDNKLYKDIRSNYVKNNKRKKTIHKVDEKNFINNLTKESVYLLGFIWGDGHILTSGRNNQVKIECVSEDINNLRNVIDSTGDWTYNKRNRGSNKKEITVVSTSNKELCKYLIENDYKNKSNVSPNKIYYLIPEDLKKYFILGWVDADGCFYRNDKYNTSQLYLSGSYEQDWSVIENFYSSINIKYTIQRIVGKTSKYSCIRVTNRLSIIEIGNLIYSDLIPLKRKYIKFLAIKNYGVTLATP